MTVHSSWTLSCDHAFHMDTVLLSSRTLSHDLALHMELSHDLAFFMDSLMTLLSMNSLVTLPFAWTLVVTDLALHVHIVS